MPISTYHDTTEKQYPFPRVKVQHVLKLHFPVEEEAPSTCLCQSRGGLNDLIVCSVTFHQVISLHRA